MNKIILLIAAFVSILSLFRCTRNSTPVPVVNKFTPNSKQIFDTLITTCVFDTTTCCLEGIVLDEKNKPIDSVKIELGQDFISTYSNNKGEYYFKHFSTGGEYDMVFSKKGYQTKRFSKAKFRGAHCHQFNTKLK